MSKNELSVYTDITEKSLEPTVSRRLRAVLADAYSFVRSREVNAALATVTLEELIGDQIKLNGESGASSGAEFNPYAFKPGEESPASTEPTRTAFLGGSPVGTEDNPLPTKLDRVLAIQAELTDVIESVKKVSPVEVSDFEKYVDQSEVGLEE